MRPLPGGSPVSDVVAPGDDVYDDLRRIYNSLRIDGLAHPAQWSSREGVIMRSTTSTGPEGPMTRAPTLLMAEV
jgi:hypothetical protein